MLGPNPLAALAEALRPSALTEALKPPTFDWQTTEQYDYFCLFSRLMESWYHLQGMKEEPDDGTRLEYLLNFLGTTGQQKHEQWKHEGATEADPQEEKCCCIPQIPLLHNGSPCVPMVQDLPTRGCLNMYR